MNTKKCNSYLSYINHFIKQMASYNNVDLHKLITEYVKKYMNKKTARKYFKARAFWVKSVR